MSGKIVMIGSMKGGVSKTVTTFNLAYSLSKLGKKVLAVDFDSQANLSTCLGVENVTAVPVTIGNLMLAQIEEEELPERNILVWFGITWSLELYQQTVARLWRQGQTEGTVSVIHIVTDGTVDERILKALEAKDLTQSALIDAVKAEVGDGK